MANTAGSLELTLYLGYPLPPTTAVSQGKIEVIITPQIPAPNPATNGRLICYFFGNVPAGSVVWDTSNPAFTKIVLTTPPTHSFVYSEIPISITTEGALSPEQTGFPINQLVRRYHLEVKFFIDGAASHS